MYLKSHICIFISNIDNHTTIIIIIIIIIISRR